MSNHLKTYHSIKQKPEKFDLAVCEQLLNNFRVTIDHAWEMMSEKGSHINFFDDNPVNFFYRKKRLLKEYNRSGGGHSP